jgi:2-keto-4-pentenoate hydratase/2-oxohepta-3-ene-1,7-dioic acid hydratase in catechol pathway
MKIICVGRNYGEHARELNNEIPEEPVIFLKPDTALLKDNKPFYLPDFSEDIHYEAEVVFKIGRNGKNIEEKFARKYIAEISLGIDFTARDLQNKLKAKGLPWELAKGFDSSAVIGKFITTEESGDLSAIDFSLQKNYETVQKGNTADMLFGIDKLISFISRYISLKTGDLIYTGTPKGVGKVSIGDQYKGFIGQKEVFSFNVK